jgi:hypothetical protein
MLARTRTNAAVEITKTSDGRQLVVEALYQLTVPPKEGVMAAIGPLQMPRPTAVASGYRGAAGTTLTFDCSSHSINQKDA